MQIPWQLSHCESFTKKKEQKYLLINNNLSLLKTLYI